MPGRLARFVLCVASFDMEAQLLRQRNCLKPAHHASQENESAMSVAIAHHVVRTPHEQMPPLSLWRWGFETKPHHQICTNTTVCNHFTPSSLCDHVGETF